MSDCGDKSGAGKSIHATNNPSVGHVVEQAAVGFASGGDRYDAYRPSYTEEAVSLIASEIVSASCSPSHKTATYQVLELGAGTGKLTEGLIKKLPENMKYLATEPSENFMNVLNEKGLKIDTALASADSIPLGDNSVGSVVCAQCFHWFSDKINLESIRRVLVPEGKLILIWNMKNFNEGWMKYCYDQRKVVVAKISGSMKFLVNSNEWRKEIDVSPLFKLQYHKSLAGINFHGDVNRILANLTTASAYNALPTEEREKYVEELRQMLLNCPGLDPTNIAVPYTTELYVYTAQ